MQRTTVRLPDDLLDDAKELARRTGRSLTQLLEDAVRAELASALTATTRQVAEGSVRYDRPLPPPLRTTDRIDSGVAQWQSGRDRLRAQVTDIQDFLRTLPDRDHRSADEILDYDATGLPG